jgi:hypothetical protein
MNSMLKWITVLLLTAIAAAQTAAPAPSAAQPAASATNANPWLPPATGNEDAAVKKARNLFTQMIEAMGGQAYMDIQTVEQTGLTYSFYNGRPNSVGTEFHLLIKFPDKERMELTKQRDVVYIENADNGYEVTYKGTALQEPKTWREYVRRRNHSMDWVLRVWLKKPTTQIYYEGSAIAEQRMADVVSLMDETSDSVTFYIDQNTHLPIKKVFSFRSPLDKQKDEDGEIYGNWRPENGINTPHSVVRTHNGDYTNQRFIKTINFNVPAPDSLFQAKVTYDPYVLERRLDEQEQQHQKQR